jgi:hypothetical protein
LRDYKIEPQVWDGERWHAHVWGERVIGSISVRQFQGQRPARYSRRQGAQTRMAISVLRVRRLARLARPGAHARARSSSTSSTS